MNLHQFRLIIDNIDDNTVHNDYDVAVKLCSKGTIGGTPVSSVKNVYQGFDWDTGKIIITTEDRLTKRDCAEVWYMYAFKESGKFYDMVEIDLPKEDVYILKEKLSNNMIDTPYKDMIRVFIPQNDTQDYCPFAINPYT